MLGRSTSLLGRDSTSQRARLRMDYELLGKHYFGNPDFRIADRPPSWQLDDTWALVASYFVAFESNCWYLRGALGLDKSVRQ